MRRYATNLRRALRAWIPLALLAGAGCSPLSEQVEDPSAGRNGGFEHMRSGLPVNWLVYSPTTVPSGSFEILFDRTDFKEGEQSLAFLVRECSAAGGRRSPGIAQRYPATPGGTYAIGFWIKSEDCDWAVSFGGVGPETGETEVLDSSELPAGSWHRVDREYTVPPRYESLRFELGITSPGSLWIDDVSIAPVVGDSPGPAEVAEPGAS